jgi:hypothetical protein
LAQPMTQITRALPTEIVVRADDLEVAFTPRELRMIREQTGRSWSQIVTDEESDDKFTAMAWLRLRREGHQLTLEEMDDVVIRIKAAEPPDPTSSGRSATSPNSASSTG